MKKLVISVFVLALLAAAAAPAFAYDYTIGGNLGYNRTSYPSYTSTTYAIAPELAKIIDADTNIGVGLSYSYAKSGSSSATKEFGLYLFAERAVLNPGPFKVFVRGDFKYTNTDNGGGPNTNSLSVGIQPNIQYDLTDRLTLMVSSSVVNFNIGYSTTGGSSTTNFGFNAGRGNVTSVGLKYAFGGEEKSKPAYAPAPQPVPQPVTYYAPAPTVQPAPVKQPSVEMGPLYFASGSKQLGPNMRQHLTVKANELKNTNFSKIYITGHADSKEANAQTLSEARAKAVVDYLQTQGIPASKMAYKGAGATQPLQSNATEAGRKMNRRVEFSIK